MSNTDPVEIKTIGEGPFATFRIVLGGMIAGDIEPGDRPGAGSRNRIPDSWVVNTDPENRPTVGTYLQTRTGTPGGAVLALMQHHGRVITSDVVALARDLTGAVFA